MSLACRKAKYLGYPHELCTTRLLARYAREHGPAAGHACLANLAQGTVCKILGAQAIKPHKVRFYLERRDPEFEGTRVFVLTRPAACDPDHFVEPHAFRPRRWLGETAGPHDVSAHIRLVRGLAFVPAAVSPYSR